MIIAVWLLLFHSCVVVVVAAGADGGGDVESTHGAAEAIPHP